MYFLIAIGTIAAGIIWTLTLRAVKDYSGYWIMVWFFIWASPITVTITYAAQNLSVGYFIALFAFGIVFAFIHVIGTAAALFKD